MKESCHNMMVLRQGCMQTWIWTKEKRISKETPSHVYNACKRSNELRANFAFGGKCGLGGKKQTDSLNLLLFCFPFFL